LCPCRQEDRGTPRVAKPSPSRISEILAGCSESERRELFQALLATEQVHKLETMLKAPATVILEAIHRAPELTRRMLRGIIADAAFARYTIPSIQASGWRDVTPPGNFAFDYLVEDATGQISVQVKLQRSENQEAVITVARKAKGRSKSKWVIGPGMYTVETQRTRGGKKKRSDVSETSEDIQTRPYRFGDFDVLAVSLQPSGKPWSAFRYTVAGWLLPGIDSTTLAVMQPVPMQPNADWTDDFNEVAKWFRSRITKQISTGPTTSATQSELI
jgi:hypothetical protein